MTTSGKLVFGLIQSNTCAANHSLLNSERIIGIILIVNNHWHVGYNQIIYNDARMRLRKQWYA